MAVRSVTGTLGVDLGNGSFNSSGSVTADPVALVAAQAALLATAKTDSTAVVAAAVPVAAALAVLVADGASPTQAHVNTLNAAYTTLATAISASDTATQAVTLAGVTTALGANLVLLLDTAVLTSRNAVKSALKSALQMVSNLGITITS